MLSEADARAQILARLDVGAAEAVPLAEALGRFAARDVLSPLDLPPFANSAMDGYAVRSGDAARGSILRLVGEQRRGSTAD
ncbi:MAG: hypothetical protein R3F11_11240 [Verrucomicrobiales bacterium]